MTQIHEDLEIKQFSMSSNVISRQVCAESGMLPTEYCPDKITEFFDSTKSLTFPTIPCTLHSEPVEEPEPTDPDTPEPSDPDAPETPPSEPIIIVPDLEPTEAP
jgi:penicillin-binding protein 1A